MKKRNHLTDTDRYHIELLLNERTSLKQIAHFSTSTISREIRKHSTISDKSAPFRIPNRCIDARTCSKTSLSKAKLYKTMQAL